MGAILRLSIYLILLQETFTGSWAFKLFHFVGNFFLHASSVERILTRSNDQMQMGQQIVDQEAECIVDRLGINQMVAVENQEYSARDGCNLIDELGQDVLDGAAAGITIYS